MRWFWIDRFTEFVSGQYAEAVKAVSLAEDHLTGYCSIHPYLPASLMIEGMAQAGGLLVSQLQDFQQRVVLAKVLKSDFPRVVVPGETLRYRVELENVQPQGAFVSGSVRVGDQVAATAGLVFAFLDDARFGDVELFEPADFYRMLRLVKLFDVGQTSDGKPLAVPPRFLEAERADLSH